MSFEIKFKNGDSKTFESLWEADLRSADLCGASLRGASLGGANLRGADLRGADLRGANLREANLRGANLREANLRGANLWRADLYGANLYGANLYGANLCGSDLREASLSGAKGIITFQFSRHFAVSFQHRGQVYAKIGCKTMLISDWVEDFIAVGGEEGYSDMEIEAYGDWLKWVNVKNGKLFP